MSLKFTNSIPTLLCIFFYITLHKMFSTFEVFSRESKLKFMFNDSIDQTLCMSFRHEPSDGGFVCLYMQWHLQNAPGD